MQKGSENQYPKEALVGRSVTNLTELDVLIEIKSRDVFLIYSSVASYVDDFLRNDLRPPEKRVREDHDGVAVDHELTEMEHSDVDPVVASISGLDPLSIFLFGVTYQTIKGAIESLGVPVEIVRKIDMADIVLTTQAKAKNQKKKLDQLTKGREVSLHVIADEYAVQKFLKAHYQIPETQDFLEKEACNDVRIACKRALSECRVVEMIPQSKQLRQIQHKEARRLGLNSMSVGQEPNRRVRIYPKGD